MSKAKKPELVKLCELQPGIQADCFAQLVEKVHSTTREGKEFYSCRFRDLRRSVAVAVWGDGELYEACHTHWQVGEFYKLRAVLFIHEKYGPKIDIEQIRGVEERDSSEGFTTRDFLERSRFEPDETFATLVAFAEAEVKDEPLRALVHKLLHDHAAHLKLLPASPRHYYPFAGGWLEHTLNVTRHSAWLADRYREQFPDLLPPLNRDLVIAGAVLHDIGRVKEFDAAAPGQLPRPGITSELFTPLFLAYELIRSTAKEIAGLNAELLELLLHIVVTHLKLPEWGSPRIPAIPEVLIVHHADDLDAKFEMYARCLTRDASDGPFTERDPVLGRILLKARSL